MPDFLTLVEQAYIVTRSGHRFNPFAPTDDAVQCIEDIAYALAQQVRYGGHCEGAYSVGQHCVIVATALRTMNRPPCVQLCGLLHDASEALGLPDLPAPIKAVMPAYEKLEEGIQRHVAKVYGLPWPFPKEVHEVDRSVRRVEIQWCLSQSMKGAFPALDTQRYGEELGVFNTLHISPLPTPEDVVRSFMTLYFAIQADRGDKARPREHGRGALSNCG